jgi:hypothetical protein
MRLKSALIGLMAAGGVALSAGAASAAMPNGLPASNQVSNVDQVRYVCNAWGRCWWRPNYYRSYGYYGPRRFYGGPRFYGGWRGGGWHGHRGWHHRW